MNKNILIIAGLLIAQQSFADISATNGVANSATCDSGALDTDSGGAALEAQYSPETIDLNWYDNNGNLITTNSCTYDNGITLPSNPTRAGYTFKGWRVIFDLTTLNYSIGAPDENSAGNYCWCRVIKFQPAGSTTLYKPLFSKWVRDDDRFGDTYACKNGCARYCVRTMGSITKFRRSIYGVQ